MGIIQALCRRDDSYRGDFESVSPPLACGVADCTAAVYRNWDKSVLDMIIQSSSHQDDNGEWHYHDHNRYSEHWYCTADHRFSRRVYKTCWCGWTQRPIDASSTPSSPTPAVAPIPAPTSTTASPSSTSLAELPPVQPTAPSDHV